jgi:acyl-CoA thioesterase-1
MRLVAGRGSLVAGPGWCVRGVLVLALACGRPSDGGTAQTTRASAESLSRPATAAPGRATDRRTILFVGTSLTAGLGLDPDSAYPQQIQRMLDSAGLRYDVINAGISGETSSALLNRLDWLMRQPFDVIVIETGANDGLRGIPVEAMAQNVDRIVSRVRAARPDARVLLVQMEAPPNLGNSYTRRFHEVFPAAAKRAGATLMPFLLQDVAGVRELNQGDGIHPNDQGERIVARNVWKALRPLL